MIIGSILELDLDNQEKHLRTSWQISDTKDFTNIIAESLDDDVNLLSIIFPDITPTKDQELYGRARVLTTNGWSTYNNLDIVSRDLDDEIFILPSRISVPRLYTSKYDSKANRVPTDDLTPENHPLTLFYISNDESYTVIGDSEHIASTWLIEDLEGNVVWKSIKNRKDLNIIKVDDLILERNKVYTARHIMHSSTNDISDCTSYKFQTVGLYNHAMYAWLENTFNHLPVDYQNGFEVTVPYDQGITDVFIEIYVNKNDKLSLVLDMQLNNGNRVLQIGPNVIRPNGLYTILFKSNLTDQFDVLTFSTF